MMKGVFLLRKYERLCKERKGKKGRIEEKVKGQEKIFEMKGDDNSREKK